MGHMSESDPKIALFPGTFDPMTSGHLDIIRRAAGLFDQLVVAIGTNPDKRDLFSTDERRTLAQSIVDAEGLAAVSVEVFKGLTVDFAKQRGARVIVRGLRNAADLAHEFQLALTNRAVADLETVFIMSGEPYGYTSSSLIKQIAAAGQVDRLERLLPPQALDLMRVNLHRLAGPQSDVDPD
jgi:pantetheine-phosphate adenylyltransferase